MYQVKYFLVPFTLLVYYHFSASDEKEPTCLASTKTVHEAVDCFRTAGPLGYSHDYSPPSASSIEDFEKIFVKILSHALSGSLTSTTCKNIFSETNIFLPNYTTVFKHNLCWLAEDDPPQGMRTGGHGLFLLRNLADREVIFMAPHSNSDLYTASQSASVFQRTATRGVIVSTSHRYANEKTVGCQNKHPNSDPAHAVGSYFHRATYAIAEVYGDVDFTTIQFHGMGRNSCPGVAAYITEGLNVAPAPWDKSARLKAAMLGETSNINITVPWDVPPCLLTGATNTQGRVLNGVARGTECYSEARRSLGHFLHIEQKIDLRRSTFWETWASAINATL